MHCQLFGTYPDAPVRALLTLGEKALYSSEMTLDPQNGNQISMDLPADRGDGSLKLAIEDMNGTELFSGSISVSK